MSYSHQNTVTSRDSACTDKIDDNPRDTVQVIRWMPGDKSTVFAVGSWDFKLRVYEVTKGGTSYSSKSKLELRGMVDMGAPVFAIEWLARDLLMVGLGDGQIFEVSLTNGNKNQVTRCDAPICEIKYYEDRENKILLVFLFDERILAHKLGSQDRFPSETVKLDYRICCADLQGSRVAVGLTESKLLIIELNNLIGSRTRFTYQDSALNSKISSITLKPSKNILVAGTYDGRVTCLTISTPTYSSGNFSLNNDIIFRAQKLNTGRSSAPEILCPITSIHHSGSYYNDGDSFLTAGSNGEIKVWDRIKKSDCLTIETPGKEISYARFNSDGTLLAYAVGYSWSKGIWGLKDVNYVPEVFVHEIEKKHLQSY